MRLFSEMILFVVVCLVIVSVVYGAQEAFLPADTSGGTRWQSRAQLLVPLHSWDFDEDTAWPSAPAKPAEPLLAPVPIPPPANRGNEDMLQDGDAFFSAKFQNL